MYNCVDCKKSLRSIISFESPSNLEWHTFPPGLLLNSLGSNHCIPRILSMLTAPMPATHHHHHHQWGRQGRSVVSFTQGMSILRLQFKRERKVSPQWSEEREDRHQPERPVGIVAQWAGKPWGEIGVTTPWSGWVTALSTSRD